MSEAQSILTLISGMPARRPDYRQASVPFRELLAWKRRQRADAIRRHQALRRDDLEQERS